MCHVLVGSDVMISTAYYSLFTIQGRPIKNRTAYFQHYEDAINGIECMGVTFS